MPTIKRETELIDGVEHIRCTNCLEMKSPDNYSIRKERGKPNRQCKKCMSARRAKWKHENPQKQKIYDKNFRIINRDKRKKTRKESGRDRIYYQRKRDEILEKQKKAQQTPEFRRKVAIRKKKGYEIGDIVYINTIKHKILGVVRCKGYRVCRFGNLEISVVPRRLIVPYHKYHAFNITKYSD